MHGAGQERADQELFAGGRSHEEQDVRQKKRAHQRQEIPTWDVAKSAQRGVHEDGHDESDQRHANAARADHGLGQGEGKGRVLHGGVDGASVVLRVADAQVDVAAVEDVLRRVVGAVGAQELQGAVVGELVFRVVQLDVGAVRHAQKDVIQGPVGHSVGAAFENCGFLGLCAVRLNLLYACVVDEIPADMHDLSATEEGAISVSSLITKVRVF